MGSEDSVGVVKRIGDYRPNRHPTLAGAVRALGEPTSTSGGGSEARVRISRVKASVLFIGAAGD